MPSGIAPCFRALIILLIAAFASPESSTQGTGEIHVFKAPAPPAQTPAPKSRAGYNLVN
ncbi:MAG: hypothetical protein KGR46_02420 [Verrucomicrobia bacterium]|nr:hypothetical protein [Verrucomicrobiota bacterium]